MADGSAKAIALVLPGDWVKSRNEATGKDEARQVTASVKRLAPAVVTVSFSDSKTGRAETLACTPEHPLFVQGQGWVEAGSVGIGTSIVSRAACLAGHGPNLAEEQDRGTSGGDGQQLWRVHGLQPDGGR